jgi:hypothetical protein
MLANVSPDGSSREIVAPARRQSHDKTNRLSVVEVIGQ